MLDGDEVPVGGGELVGHVAADPPEAADDEMAVQLANLLFHATPPQRVIEIGFEKEHREAGEQEGDCPEAGQRDQAGKQPLAEAVDLDDLAVAHRGDGDQRHVEGIGEAGPLLADQIETCGPDRYQREQRADREVDAQQDARKLAVPLRQVGGFAAVQVQQAAQQGQHIGDFLHGRCALRRRQARTRCWRQASRTSR